jgi:hypothetical protein
MRKEMYTGFWMENLKERWHLEDLGKQTNGQGCAIKCTSFLNEKEYTVPQWALKLISAPTAAEIQNLKGCILNVKVDLK